MNRFFTFFATALLVLTLTSLNLHAASTPQYVVLDGYDNLDSNAKRVALATLNLLSEYKDGAARLNFSSDLLEKNPSLKVLILPLRGLEWRYGGTEGQVDTIRNLVSAAYAAGKHILIYGDTYLQGANAIGEPLFKDTFGASASFMDIQDKYDGTTLTPFMVKGISTDELGNGINLSANTVADGATRAIGSVRSELSSIIPFLYYDEDKSNIAGVRRQGAKARAILLSFRLESIADDTQRSAFLKKMLDWLSSAGTTDVETTTEKQLTLSPNPCTDNIVLRFSTLPQGKVHIRLVDMIGRTVLEQESMGSEQLRLDIASVPNGSYSVQIQSGVEYVVRSVVVQR